MHARIATISDTLTHTPHTHTHTHTLTHTHTHTLTHTHTHTHTHVATGVPGSETKTQGLSVIATISV
jgi:hypothetical protein